MGKFILYVPFYSFLRQNRPALIQYFLQQQPQALIDLLELIYGYYLDAPVLYWPEPQVTKFLAQISPQLTGVHPPSISAPLASWGNGADLSRVLQD